jgi:hypothetical protein
VRAASELAINAARSNLELRRASLGIQAHRLRLSDRVQQP